VPTGPICRRTFSAGGTPTNEHHVLVGIGVESSASRQKSQNPRLASTATNMKLAPEEAMGTGPYMYIAVPAEPSASGAVEEAAKVGALHGVHDPESGGGGTKRFRPVPTLGALAHHLEKVAQSLAVDVDLDVVAQRGGRVVEGDVDFAELGAEVLR
jgi:hypothetical protein